MSAAVLWQGHVEKVSSGRPVAGTLQPKSHPRLLVVSAAGELFVCLPTGGVTRTIGALSVAEVVVFEPLERATPVDDPAVFADYYPSKWCAEFVVEDEPALSLVFSSASEGERCVEAIYNWVKEAADGNSDDGDGGRDPMLQRRRQRPLRVRVEERAIAAPAHHNFSASVVRGGPSAEPGATPRRVMFSGDASANIRTGSQSAVADEGRGSSAHRVPEAQDDELAALRAEVRTLRTELASTKGAPAAASPQRADVAPTKLVLSPPHRTEIPPDRFLARAVAEASSRPDAAVLAPMLQSTQHRLLQLEEELQRADADTRHHKGRVGALEEEVQHLKTTLLAEQKAQFEALRAEKDAEIGQVRTAFKEYDSHVQQHLEQSRAESSARLRELESRVGRLTDRNRTLRHQLLKHEGLNSDLASDDELADAPARAAELVESHLHRSAHRPKPHGGRSHVDVDDFSALLAQQSSALERSAIFSAPRGTSRARPPAAEDAHAASWIAPEQLNALLGSLEHLMEAKTAALLREQASRMSAHRYDRAEQMVVEGHRRDEVSRGLDEHRVRKERRAREEEALAERERQYLAQREALRYKLAREAADDETVTEVESLDEAGSRHMHLALVKRTGSRMQGRTLRRNHYDEDSDDDRDRVPSRAGRGAVRAQDGAATGIVESGSEGYEAETGDRVLSHAATRAAKLHQKPVPHTRSNRSGPADVTPTSRAGGPPAIGMPPTNEATPRRSLLSRGMRSPVRVPATLGGARTYAGTPRQSHRDRSIL